MRFIVVLVALVSILPFAQAEPADLVAAGFATPTTPLACKGTACGCGMTQVPVTPTAIVVRYDAAVSLTTVTVGEGTRWGVSQCTDMFPAGLCVFDAAGTFRCALDSLNGPFALTLGQGGALSYTRPVLSPYTGAYVQVTWSGTVTRIDG